MRRLTHHRECSHDRLVIGDLFVYLVFHALNALCARPEHRYHFSVNVRLVLGGGHHSKANLAKSRGLEPEGSCRWIGRLAATVGIDAINRTRSIDHR